MDHVIRTLMAFRENVAFEQERAKTAPEESDRRSAEAKLNLYGFLIRGQIQRLEDANSADAELIFQLIEKHGGRLSEKDGKDGAELARLFSAIEKRQAIIDREKQLDEAGVEASIPGTIASATGTVGLP